MNREDEFQEVLCMVRLSQRKQLSRGEVVRICGVINGQGPVGRTVGETVIRVMRRGVNQLLSQTELTRSPLAALMEEKVIMV